MIIIAYSHKMVKKINDTFVLLSLDEMECNNIRHYIEYEYYKEDVNNHIEYTSYSDETMENIKLYYDDIVAEYAELREEAMLEWGEALNEAFLTVFDQHGLKLRYKR